MKGAKWTFMLAGASIASTAAFASETIVHSYDAKGRLIKVVSTVSGGTNSVKTTTYTHDKSDNRQNVKTQ